MESSASLPPSTVAETDQNIPCGGVAEENGNENHPPAGELPQSTDTVNIDGNGIEHQQIASLEIRPSESDTTNASTTLTLPETQGTEQQAIQPSQQTQVPQQLHDQRSQQQEQQQQQRQQQPQAQQEPEREVVLPATDTSMSSQKPMFVLRPVNKYIDIVCICISVLAYLLETTLNAALAIFGIGVGVGLVLGDSFRATLPLLPAVQASQQQQQQTAAATNINANSTMTASGVQEMPRGVPNSLPAQ